jgi:hypothetical protein
MTGLNLSGETLLAFYNRGYVVRPQKTLSQKNLLKKLAGY